MPYHAPLCRTLKAHSTFCIARSRNSCEIVRAQPLPRSTRERAVFPRAFPNASDPAAAVRCLSDDEVSFNFGQPVYHSGRNNGKILLADICAFNRESIWIFKSSVQTPSLRHRSLSGSNLINDN